MSIIITIAVVLAFLICAAVIVPALWPRDFKGGEA